MLDHGRKTQYPVPACLIADALGIIIAIAAIRLMFLTIRELRLEA